MCPRSCPCPRHARGSGRLRTAAARERVIRCDWDWGRGLDTYGARPGRLRSLAAFLTGPSLTAILIGPSLGDVLTGAPLGAVFALPLTAFFAGLFPFPVAVALP